MIQLYSCLPFFRICFHLCSTSLWLQYCSTNVSSPSTPTVSHIKITQLRNSSEYPEQNTCSVLIYRKKNPTYGVFLLLLLRLRLWSSQDHRTTESQAHRITRTQNHRTKGRHQGGRTPQRRGELFVLWPPPHITGRVLSSQTGRQEAQRTGPVRCGLPPPPPSDT